MTYPINLISSYREKKITRGEFCEKYAILQGFSDEVKGYSNTAGTFATYRGRTARVDGDAITWRENGKQQTARSFKEFKVRIDIEELKAVA